MAFKLRDHNRVKFPEWNWHVGLTFSNHVGLDFDGTAQALTIIEYAKQLMKFHELGKIAVFKTENGYWIISPTEVTLTKFLDFYKRVIEIKDVLIGLDVAHAEISYKYAKTTFRITKKNPDAPFACKLIGMYSQ